MKKSLYKKVEAASLVLGLALFAYLIKQTGVEALAHYLWMLGWGALLILGLSAVRNLLRAGSWYFAIDPEHRNVSFLQLTNVMLAGEAIKYLTATGPFLGEPAKAAMVGRDVPLLQGFSSILVENLIYNLSVVFFMLAGLPALAWLIEVPDHLRVAGYVFVGAASAAVAAGWLTIRLRWYLISRMLEMAGRALPRRRGGLGAAAVRARKLEENVYTFYDRRRGAFFLILGLNMAAHLINVVEVYAILALIGLPGTLAAGFVIEAVTKVINIAFFFVPTRAGVYESGNALVMGAIGLGAGAGVALAIIRKLRAFAWVGYGLAVIALITVRDRRSGRAREAGRHAEDGTASTEGESVC
jgi:hypothetical protein